MSPLSRSMPYDHLSDKRLTCQRTGHKPLLTAKPKVKRLQTASAHIQSLNEVLTSPQIANQLKDTKYSQEIQAIEKLDKMLTSDELRATYGEGHIDKAAERGAIGTLLISDGLFRYARILALRQIVL